MLTARAEGLLYGVGDLDEIIRRLCAFEAAGADVLYAPGLRAAEEIRTVVSAVTRPVNVVMGFADPTLTLERLSELGVRRVSRAGSRAWRCAPSSTPLARCAPAASSSCGEWRASGRSSTHSRASREASGSLKHRPLALLTVRAMSVQLVAVAE
jgi:hypothetical protein